MNIQVKTISTEKKEDALLIKVEVFNDSDIRTPNEALPYGIDSNPVGEVLAIMHETATRGEEVVSGYIQDNRQAEPGEMRIYSTNTSGEEQFYTWHKADGTYQIGGTAYHAIRYEPTETAFEELKADHNGLVEKHNALVSDFNSLVSLFNAHTHVYSPGPLTPASSATPASPGAPSAATDTESAADISPAKVDKVTIL